MESDTALPLNSEQARAWRKLKASLIAVSGHLEEPYPDAPEWTPWTRFVKPAVERMEKALVHRPKTICEGTPLARQIHADGLCGCNEKDPSEEGPDDTAVRP